MRGGSPSRLANVQIRALVHPDHPRTGGQRRGQGLGRHRSAPADESCSTTWVSYRSAMTPGRPSLSANTNSARRRSAPSRSPRAATARSTRQARTLVVDLLVLVPGPRPRRDLRSGAVRGPGQESAIGRCAHGDGVAGHRRPLDLGDGPREHPRVPALEGSFPPRTRARATARPPQDRSPAHGRRALRSVAHERPAPRSSQRRPFLIGVAGGTGSGKTTVAERLAAIIGSGRARSRQARLLLPRSLRAPLRGARRHQLRPSGRLRLAPPDGPPGRPVPRRAGPRPRLRLRFATFARRPPPSSSPGRSSWWRGSSSSSRPGCASGST